MVELNSSCLETYKITFKSCLYLVWFRRYDKKLILVALLDFFIFFKMLKGENSTPLDVIIYMLEMNNQQRKNYIRQKLDYKAVLRMSCGLFLTDNHILPDLNESDAFSHNFVKLSSKSNNCS